MPDDDPGIGRQRSGTSRTSAEADLVAAHRKSLRNREAISKAEFCGCFHCCAQFEPSEITQWVDDATEDPDSGTTAICPRCGIDSVLPIERGMDADFFGRMKLRWFGRDERACRPCCEVGRLGHAPHGTSWRQEKQRARLATAGGDMGEYGRVESEFWQLCGCGRLTKVDLHVVEVVELGDGVQTGDLPGGMTGLRTYYREDGTVICQESLLGGLADGCTRYFDRAGGLVAEDYYVQNGLVQTRIFK